MLHIDILTPPEFKSLAVIKGDTCVSLYLPTELPRDHERQNRIALKVLAQQALQKLKEAGIDKHRIELLADQFRHLAGVHKDNDDDDKIRKLQNEKPDPIDEFWKFQGHGLAVLATPTMMRTFRMPYRPKPLAEVADRFHLTPLIRAMTLPHEIYVLTLADKDVRLVRIFVNLPPVKIMYPSFRKVEKKWRGEHPSESAALSAPLVLAADEPLASIYRSINTYPGLVDETIAGNPSLITGAQLKDAALPILDRLYKRQLSMIIARFDELKPRRATTDVSYTAHAVTAGAVDELLIDLDAVIPGFVSEIDGSVTYAAATMPRSTASLMKSRGARSLRAPACSARDATTSPRGRHWLPSCVINSDEAPYWVKAGGWGRYPIWGDPISQKPRLHSPALRAQRRASPDQSVSPSPWATPSRK